MLELSLIELLVFYCRQKAAEKDIIPHFQITTNGTLLTEKTVKKLSELKISVAVSIDGCEKAHDANRLFPSGSGSHSEVEKGLKNALKAWQWVPTMSVLDPSNIAIWGESFEYLFSLGCRRMHFSINYETEWSDGDLKIFDKAAGEVAELWLKKLRKNIDVRLSFFDNKIITHLKEGFDDCDRCSFGVGEIAVAPSGNLYPCDRLVGEDDREHFIIGTVEKGVDLKKALALKAYQKKPPEECGECEYNDRCVNYCGCVNYALSGCHDKVSGEICRFEQTAIRHADRIAETLFAEQNPIFMERFYHSIERRQKRFSNGEGLS
ncbi:MAG: hypothetical protein Kow0090_18130 [Myxococcota bacterium]